MIQNQDTAIQHFVKDIMKNEVGVIQSFHTNKEDIYSPKHYVCQSKLDKQRYYCLFKESFFRTFTKQFPHTEQLFGVQEGESLNLDALKRANKYNCETIVFIHPESTYKIFTKQFENIAFAHDLGRVQDKQFTHKFVGGIKKKVHEVTYSVPVSSLEPMKDKQTKTYTIETIGELGL